MWFIKPRIVGRHDGSFTMSRSNTDAICMKCAEEERQHHDYQLAADAELAAVRSGNRNFADLGWSGRNGRVKR